MESRTHIDLSDETISEVVAELGAALPLNEGFAFVCTAGILIARLQDMTNQQEKKEPNTPILHIHTIGKWEVCIKELDENVELTLFYDGKLRLIRTLPNIDKAYQCAMTALAN